MEKRPVGNDTVAAASPQSLIGQLRKLAVAQAARQATDQQLLQGWSVAHDQGAFAQILERHGPMVLAVCRHVLHDNHDAEDAFQATFLVLALKAAAIRKREALTA